MKLKHWIKLQKEQAEKPKAKAAPRKKASEKKEEKDNTE